MTGTLGLVFWLVSLRDYLWTGCWPGSYSAFFRLGETGLQISGFLGGFKVTVVSPVEFHFSDCSACLILWLDEQHSSIIYYNSVRAFFMLYWYGAVLWTQVGLWKRCGRVCPVFMFARPCLGVLSFRVVCNADLCEEVTFSYFGFRCVTDCFVASFTPLY